MSACCDMVAGARAVGASGACGEGRGGLSQGDRGSSAPPALSNGLSKLPRLHSSAPGRRESGFGAPWMAPPFGANPAPTGLLGRGITADPCPGAHQAVPAGGLLPRRRSALARGTGAVWALGWAAAAAGTTAR